MLVSICVRTGAGNYFRPHDLRMTFAGRMWPAGRMLPPPGLGGLNLSYYLLLRNKKTVGHP